MSGSEKRLRSQKRVPLSERRIVDVVEELDSLTMSQLEAYREELSPGFFDILFFLNRYMRRYGAVDISGFFEALREEQTDNDLVKIYERYCIWSSLGCDCSPVLTLDEWTVALREILESRQKKKDSLLKHGGEAYCFSDWISERLGYVSEETCLQQGKSDGTIREDVASWLSLDRQRLLEVGDLLIESLISRLDRGEPSDICAYSIELLSSHYNRAEMNLYMDVECGTAASLRVSDQRPRGLATLLNVVGVLHAELLTRLKHDLAVAVRSTIGSEFLSYFDVIDSNMAVVINQLLDRAPTVAKATQVLFREFEDRVNEAVTNGFITVNLAQRVPTHQAAAFKTNFECYADFSAGHLGQRAEPGYLSAPSIGLRGQQSSKPPDTKSVDKAVGVASPRQAADVADSDVAEERASKSALRRVGALALLSLEKSHRKDSDSLMAQIKRLLAYKLEESTVDELAEDVVAALLSRVGETLTWADVIDDAMAALIGQAVSRNTNRYLHEGGQEVKVQVLAEDMKEVVGAFQTGNQATANLQGLSRATLTKYLPAAWQAHRDR